MNETQRQTDSWIDTIERTLDYAMHARTRFAKGSPEKKKEIFQALGSNLILIDKKLTIHKDNKFFVFQKLSKEVAKVHATLEPSKQPINTGQIEALYSKNPILFHAVEAVRNWININQSTF